MSGQELIVHGRWLRRRDGGRDVPVRDFGEPVGDHEPTDATPDNDVVVGFEQWLIEVSSMKMDASC